MLRSKLLIALTLTALLVGPLLGCGDDCKGLCGSQCDLQDCKHNRVRCHGFFEDVGGERKVKDLKIFYQLGSNELGWEYVAILIFDVDGIEPIPGHCFVEQEMLDRVTLERPEGMEWPPFEGKNCCISKGGDTAGAKFEGKCGFLFDNGRTLTAPWSCTLEDPGAPE